METLINKIVRGQIFRFVPADVDWNERSDNERSDFSLVNSKNINSEPRQGKRGVQ